jgi:hypothetical protein
VEARSVQTGRNLAFTIILFSLRPNKLLHTLPTTLYRSVSVPLFSQMEKELDSSKMKTAIQRGQLMAAIDNANINVTQPSLPEKIKIARERNIFHNMSLDLKRLNLYKPRGGSIS